MTLRMALRSIGANKMRAMLTMLGIIIGVVALVVLVSLVNGATSSVTDAVSSLGSDMLTVAVDGAFCREIDAPVAVGDGVDVVIDDVGGHLVGELMAVVTFDGEVPSIVALHVVVFHIHKLVLVGLQVHVTSRALGEPLDVFVLELPSHLVEVGDEEVGQIERHQREKQRPFDIRKEETPEADAVAEHCHHLGVVGHLGGEEDDGDEGEEVDELVGEIGYRGEVMVCDHAIPGCVVFDERVDVLGEVEHDDDHHEHGHGEEEGADELE